MTQWSNGEEVYHLQKVEDWCKYKTEFVQFGKIFLWRRSPPWSKVKCMLHIWDWVCTFHHHNIMVLWRRRPPGFDILNKLKIQSKTEAGFKYFWLLEFKTQWPEHNDALGQKIHHSLTFKIWSFWPSCQTGFGSLGKMIYGEGNYHTQKTMVVGLGVWKF